MPLDLDLVCELAARCGVEQALRKLLPQEPGVVDRLTAVDADNLRWFRQLVDARGWPGRSLVGAGGAEHAWLLAQHADPDPAFQERCLELLRGAVVAGEASPVNLAYLEDRVRLHRGRAQRYGTQVVLDADGRAEPSEIDEPDTVDERRRAVGLGPLADYLAGFDEPGR